MTSWASLSQCSADCHWCPPYILFKDLFFTVAPRKLLIRPSEGWSKDFIVKALSKDVYIEELFKALPDWQNKKAQLSEKEPGLSCISLNKPLLIYSHWLKTLLPSLSAESELRNKQLERTEATNKTAESKQCQKTWCLPENVSETQAVTGIRNSAPESLSGKARNATGQCCSAPSPHFVPTSVSIKSLPFAHILVA